MSYNFNLEEIKNFISAEKEDDTFILTLAQGTWAVLQKIIGRKVEYNQYTESHKVNRDLRIYVNEPPIDSLKEIEIKILDEFYTPIAEISNFNITPELDTIVIPKNSGNDFLKFFPNFGDGYLDWNYKFYAEGLYFKVSYWGGYKELPDDLKIAFYNLIKTFYVNRDPAISKISTEGLTKIIGEINPQVMMILNSWKQIKI